MGENISKTVIRIIQDYCFNSSALILSSEFVLTVSPLISQAIVGGTLTSAKMKSIVKKRTDFIHANDLSIDVFCKGLLEKLNYELQCYTETSFQNSIIEFKRRLENGNFRGFPKEKTSEDTLRSTLSVYIWQETFCEARSSSGNNDIVVPSEKVIIETKLWLGAEYYNAGFPELNDYLDKAGYTEGYYVVFDYNKAPNKVIMEKGEIFDIRYQGRLIHVIFIRMNAVRPSKIYAEGKRAKESPII